MTTVQDKIRAELEALRSGREQAQAGRSQRRGVARSVQHSSLMEGQVVSEELSGLLEQWADGEVSLSDARAKLDARYKR